MTQEDIDKACNWLENNIDPGLIIFNNNTWTKMPRFIEKFRNAMNG